MKSEKIKKALESANETKALIIGSGVINQIAQLFKEQFFDKEAIIVADETTYNIAGKTVSELIEERGIIQQSPFIFTDNNLYAEYSYVSKLADALKKHNAIPIAVGSGTINDLTKLASYETGRPYMCVATAASMDGYTAFGSSITFEGAKQTFNCPAPQACLADINIISKAPSDMTASGYADLFAKITAGADWILADALDVEPIDSKAWSIVQDGLHEALANPEAVANGNSEAIQALTEGLMLGGFAMQWSKSSRPASGAEHQFSHLWNMDHHSNNGKSVSHGFQVAIGTLSILALYKKLLEYPIESLDIEEACNAWPTIEELQKDALARFKDTDFPLIGKQETEAKYITKEDLSIQLTKLKNNWVIIKKRIEEQIIPYQEAKEKLKLVGAPTNPEDIGISKEYLKETFIRAQYIRRRFTILDLAKQTNLLEKWVDDLFNEGLL